jgi:hypothetical protein
MKLSRLSLSWFLLAGMFGSAAIAAQACSASTVRSGFGGGGAGGQGATSGTGGMTSSTSGQGGQLLFEGGLDAPACELSCSPDLHAVIDCSNQIVQQCMGAEGCDASQGKCTNACSAAIANKQSVGCDYYATFMDQYNPSSCFAVFVANTWNTPAHIDVEYQGAKLPVANFARLPSGQGPGLTYSAYDPVAGLPPGEVAVLFLTGPQGPQGLPGQANCPIASAIGSNVMTLGTGIGHSFHVTTDVPVVSYEINPYGGGSAAVTAGSLLLPTSVWDTNYIAVNVSPYDIANPSLNIVAQEDGTQVTMVPVAAVQGGGGIPSGPSNAQLVINLNKGENAQISQQAELTGSVISSNKPVGFMAGQNCMHAPAGTAYCDHGEQMIPPIKALGHEYAGVMYRPRVGNETSTIWRLIGTVDGTQLKYNTPVGGPATLNQGQAVEFTTGTPFVVSSQDKDHPFMLFTYMTGSNAVQDGYGDPDFVISVPPEQYLYQYVFFADPTYPETNLVIIREKGADMMFHDVTLDCAGVLTGWQPIDANYEYTRTDLITGDFQNVGNCSTGRHLIKSDAKFGLWVWGWGTPLTSTFTANVSYGYPGGMNVVPINQVVIPPQPK